MEKVGLVWFTVLPSYCHHGNQAVKQWKNLEKLATSPTRLRRMRLGEEIYLSSIPSNLVGYLYSNLQARNSWKSQGFGKAPHQYRVSGTTLRCVEFLTSISSYTKKGAEKKGQVRRWNKSRTAEIWQSLGFGDVWWVDFIRLAPKHSRIFKNIQELEELEESKKRCLIFRPVFHNWWAHEFHGSPSCEVVRRPQGSRGAAQAATPRAMGSHLSWWGPRAGF